MQSGVLNKEQFSSMLVSEKLVKTEFAYNN